MLYRQAKRSQASKTGQSVRFRKILPDTGNPSVRHVYFTPKRMFFENGHFFAIGVHHVKKRIETVDLHEITETKLVQYRQPKVGEAVERVWRVYEPRA